MISGPPLTLREILFPLSIVLAVLGLLWWFLASPTPEGGRKRPVPQPIDKADYLWAATLAVCFYLLALWRLGTPDVTYFDEVHHVPAAMEYVLGKEPREWTHPPIPKLLMAESLTIANEGFDPTDGVWSDQRHYAPRTVVAWRFPSVLFGTFALLFQFALARSLFQNRAVAIAATVMLACDGLFFVHARIGMTNIFTVCFMLMSTLGTWQYIRHGQKRWLLLTGIGLGLAIATRWSMLIVWGFTGLLLLWQLVTAEPGRWAKQKLTPRQGFARWAAMVVVAMAVLPLSIYTVSYFPYIFQQTKNNTAAEKRERIFTSGEPTAPDWKSVFTPGIHARGHGWYKVLDQQEDMWSYHSGLKATHPYSSPWWSWPLVLRPTWYHFQSVDGKIVGIWAIGNAFLLWAAIPALGCAAYLSWREGKPALAMVALFGLGQWLLWGIEPRTLIFLHYILESIPWACLALAYLGHRILTEKSASRAEEFLRWGIVGGYALLLVGWFIFYYPLLSAYPIADEYFRRHLWMGDRWI
jgi:dolichyl-phosphate-mannose-protein mannosyltransferase